MFLKLALAFFFSFALLQLKAQAILQGEVKSVSGGIIPNASVEYLHHKIGCMADEFGNFKLHKIVGDTLQISSIGYVTSFFSVQEEISFIQAMLTKDTETLKEVTVFTKKMKTVSLGYYSGYSFHQDYRGPGTENSILIPNKDNNEGYITEIKFKILNAENSPWNLRVRLRLIDTATGFPFNGIPLFDGVIPATQLSKGNRIDIKDKYILLPQVGIFATLEWQHPDNTLQKTAAHTFVTPALLGKIVSERQAFFRYTGNSNWYSNVSPEYPNSYFASEKPKHLYAPNISILVSVPKN